MSTQIDSLSIEISTGARSAAADINKLTNSLARLREQSKLTTTINNLNKLSGALEKLSKSSGMLPFIERLEKSLQGLASIPKMNSISNLTRAFNNAAPATRNLAKANDSLNDSWNKGSINLMATIQNYDTLVNAINTVADAMASVLHQAVAWDGVQARFVRSMGTNAQMYYERIEKINETMGINIQQFMSNSSLFADMMRGFGVKETDASTMAMGFTELAYDIWAGTNDVFSSLEEAMDAVRSTIGGETESIQRAGFSVIESTLQETAARHNLAVNIEKATMAEKTYLRYLTLVDQAHARSYVGVFASEMMTAEGAIRSLSQSFKTFVQALGSLFIPILQVVIPYVTAFVEILTEGIRAVASFFGIELFKIDWSKGEGIGGLADSAEEAKTGLGGAADAAKKLKDYTMGFDELNVIDPDSGSSGGAGGAGAGNGDWMSGVDLDTLWDESVFAKASQKVDELKAKIKGFFSEWSTEIALIGAAFMAWKFRKEFLKGLDIVKTALFAIGGNGDAQVGLGGFGFEKLEKVVMSMRKLLLKTPIGALIMGTGEVSLGVATTAVLAAVAAIAALVGGFVIVFKESENFRGGLVAVGKGVINLVTGVGEAIGWVADKISELGGFLKTKLEGVVPQGLLDFFSKLDIGIGDLLITAGGLALFGPWGLAIEAVVLALKGVGALTKDAIEPINLFGEGISEVTEKKVAPFLEKMTSLENTLAGIDWGNAIVSDEDIEIVASKLSEITATIMAELDADQNETLANLNPLREALADEKFAELIAKVEKSYADQKQLVTDGEARILEIMNLASDEARKLTDEEAAEIAEIQRKMKETGITYLSESETESNLILKRLKDNASQLSAEQASNVIKSALEARDTTIDAAEKQYKDIMMEAQRLYDVGAINDTEYDEIVKAAELAKDDTISAANTQYDEILKTAKTQMGEYARYIDKETGDIKSNWEIFCEDFSDKWSDTWDDMKKWWDKNAAPWFTKKFWDEKFDSIKTAANGKLAEVKKDISDKWDDIVSWYDKYIAPKFTKKYWTDKFDGLRAGFVETVRNMVNGGIDMLNSFIDTINSHLNFSWDGLTIAGKTVYEGGSVQLFTLPRLQRFERGGFIEDGLFTMNRGEIAGKFNNGKSVVANNQQIVEGIAEGVYSAVVAAMSETQQGGQAVNVYLDGKQIYSSVKRTEARRGTNLMGNQLGYVY